MPEPIVLATWKSGALAVRAAVPLVAQGRSALDAALAGAQAVEDDPAVSSVGYGGVANSVGAVSLDACVMEGRTLGSGAGAGVENIPPPAPPAPRGVEKTPHPSLAAQGAQLFPAPRGFPPACVPTPTEQPTWETRGGVVVGGGNGGGGRRGVKPGQVAFIALNPAGQIGAACSKGTDFHYAIGRESRIDVIRGVEVA